MLSLIYLTTDLSTEVEGSVVDHEGGVSPADLPQSHGQAVLVQAVVADDSDPQLVHEARLLRHEVRPPEARNLEPETVGAGEALADQIVLTRTISRELLGGEGVRRLTQQLDLTLDLLLLVILDDVGDVEEELSREVFADPGEGGDVVDEEVLGSGVEQDRSGLCR